VQAVNGIAVEHENAGAIREQIAAAGESAVEADTVAAERGGDIGGGLILGDVARLEPRHHDLLDARGLKRSDLLGADQGALLEHKVTLTDRMHRGRADRLAYRDRAEFHGLPSSFRDGPKGRARNPYAAALRSMESGFARLRPAAFGVRPGMTCTFV